MAAGRNESSRFDLEIARDIAAPRALVWRCWSEAEHLAQWWAPKPLTTLVRALELRPGGAFSSVMTTPEGKEYDVEGVFLEVIAMERIVFTDTLLAGWRPAPNPFFTAIVTMADSPAGTRYVARALHKNDEDRAKHEAMGFFDGWGTCIGQLEALAKGMMQ